MRMWNDEDGSISQAITVREAGRRGGCRTLNNHGVEFYRQIGKKGGRRTAELYRGLLTEFGKRGGRPRRPDTVKQLGEEHSEKKGAWSAPE